MTVCYYMSRWPDSNMQVILKAVPAGPVGATGRRSWKEQVTLAALSTEAERASFRELEKVPPSVR